MLSNKTAGNKDEDPQSILNVYLTTQYYAGFLGDA